MAAIISALQFGLGIALTATTAPGPAHLLYASATDGRGQDARAGRPRRVRGGHDGLPRWLRYSGIALAVTIACSGLVYLLR